MRARDSQDHIPRASILGLTGAFAGLAPRPWEFGRGWTIGARAHYDPAMIRRTDSHLDVIALDGQSLCRCCGAKRATLYGKYCCRGCRNTFLAKLAHDPTPAEIAEQTAAIRATWSPRVHTSRRVELGAVPCALRSYATRHRYGTTLVETVPEPAEGRYGDLMVE